MVENSPLVGQLAQNSAERRITPEIEGLLADFRGDGLLCPSSYEKLFLYFAEGFECYRSADGASAKYPGLRSWNGRRIDQLEGFARFVPLVGAWIRSGRPRNLTLTNGTNVDLVDLFRRGLIAGTDPRHPAYWGKIRNYDQRIVEASDIALGCWLFRDTVWSTLTSSERQNVATWLGQVVGKKVYDCGWHLFIPFVGMVLKSLGCPVDEATTRDHYDRMKSFYVGDGWFSDGPKGKIDFYNAWHVHYLLYWMQEVDPNWDHDFITNTRRTFLENFKYLLGPQGIALFGRSIGYRIATPAPLVFGHHKDAEQIPATEAKRALDAVWSYFIRNGAVVDGNITQGYHEADSRIVDNYSGPASCLWSLRSLIVAFYLPLEAPFWHAENGLLPIEKGAYRIRVAAPDWEIVGQNDGQTIELERLHSPSTSNAALHKHGPFRRALETILGIPFRPNNTEAKYLRRTYSAQRPISGKPK